MKTDVVKAIIYRRSGLVIRECKVHLKKGLNSVELEGLSKSANEDTLKINLESLKYSNLQVKNLQTTELVGKVKVNLQELESLKNKILAKEQQKSLWAKNSDFTQREHVEYDEIEKFINNYSDNVLALDDEIVKLKLELTNKQEAYKNQYRKVDRKIITFDINSPDERDEVIQFSYIEPSIYWDPVYELYAADGDSELKVMLKGKIVQNTSESWENVQLTLFTGNPTLSQTIPALYTEWINFIDYKQPTGVKYRSAAKYDLVYDAAELSEESVMKQSKAALNATLMNAAPMMEDYNNIIKTEEETTTQYELPGIWSISNKGKGLLVDLYDYNIPVNITRLLIPKHSFNGYLVAEIDSNKLDEIDGQNVSIYYNDNFIGKAAIHIDRDRETTLLSLGIDEKLTAIRKKEKFHTNALAKQKDAIKIKLTISSGNKKAINVIIRDTVPKVENKEVVVENQKLANGVLDDDGIISWSLTLEPNSTKEIEFSYDITYPKKGKIRI